MTRYRSEDDWVFASKRAKGNASYLGTEHHAKTDSSGNRDIGNQEANRMAHLPPFLFNSAPTCRNRYQSAAGFVAALIGAIDPGYLHASSHASEASGAKRSHKTPSAG